MSRVPDLGGSRYFAYCRKPFGAHSENSAAAKVDEFRTLRKIHFSRAFSIRSNRISERNFLRATSVAALVMASAYSWI